MKVVVLQSNYLPWIGYFDLINSCDVFCFYDEVQYTKNDWRNRNQFMGPNGPFWLTVPIPKEATKTTISKAIIKNNLWQKKHLKSLEQSYAKTPFFKEIMPFFQETLGEKKWSSISTLNQYLIKEIASRIGIETKIIDSSQFDLADSRKDKLLGLLIDLKCTNYISGPSGESYLEAYKSSFNENGIEISYHQYGPYPKYPQTRISDENGRLSIVDLLFNVGFDQTYKYISK